MNHRTKSFFSSFLFAIFLSFTLQASDIVPPLCRDNSNVNFQYSKIQRQLEVAEDTGVLEMEDITTLRLALDGLKQKSLDLDDDNLRCLIYVSGLQSINKSMARLFKQTATPAQ